jgi:hypothetical protein
MFASAIVQRNAHSLPCSIYDFLGIRVHGMQHFSRMQIHTDFYPQVNVLSLRRRRTIWQTMQEYDWMHTYTVAWNAFGEGFLNTSGCKRRFVLHRMHTGKAVECSWMQNAERSGICLLDFQLWVEGKCILSSSSAHLSFLNNLRS